MIIPPPMRRSRFLPLVLLTLFALPSMGEECRGSVAFHYGPALTPAQMEFFGRFDVLVTHDPLPKAQIAELHRRGTKLALYEWAVAYYGKHRKGVLNDKPLRGGVGSEDLDAFYYDPMIDRSRALVAKLRKVGYDGVFFDTTTAQSVHAEALREYRRRHPEVPYDVAFARFLRALREQLKDGVILTNQGYRAAEHYLPYVDYDVTESLLVDRFRLRSAAEIDSLMETWILPAARRYPHVKFIHLNYVAVADDATIAPVVSIARQYGHEAYVALHDVTATAMLSAFSPPRPCPPMR
jgi:hypothetical protein